jgi:hypothetical protein
MSLKNSPSFDSYEDGQLLPSKPEKPTEPPRKILSSPLQYTILALSVVAFILGVMMLVTPHYGGVVGTVRDIDGNPLRAEVSIAGITGATQTNEHGQFVFANIPSGPQHLKIRYGEMDVTFLIGIPEEDSFSIGQIQLDSGA